MLYMQNHGFKLEKEVFLVPKCNYYFQYMNVMYQIEIVAHLSTMEKLLNSKIVCCQYLDVSFYNAPGSLLNY